MSQYIGRFAPSPTGPLHKGSLACALASYLDARAHEGKWVVRIEDIDPPREPKGCAEKQLQTLEAFGLISDYPILYQSQRHDAYLAAMKTLSSKGWIYGCSCTRREILAERIKKNLPPHVYPGTCRNGTKGRAIRAWRFRVPDQIYSFHDRFKGFFSQNLSSEVGDLILKRADGFWAYQLAVVVDDAFQDVTHVIRGSDLLDNTPRQLVLQEALGVKHPVYGHIDLVLNTLGQKLSKQTLAPALNLQKREEELLDAFVHLGFNPFSFDSIKTFYPTAIARWKQKFHL